MKRDILLVAIGYVMAMVWIAVMGATSVQVAPPGVTTGPPIVINGTLNATSFTTLIPGTGSGYIVWTLTNEDSGTGIRCEYGGISGAAPAVEPTPTIGSLVAAGVSLIERTAPSNRLDCIATAGTPKYDLTLYPK